MHPTTTSPSLPRPIAGHRGGVMRWRLHTIAVMLGGCLMALAGCREGSEQAAAAPHPSAGVAVTSATSANGSGTAAGTASSSSKEAVPPAEEPWLQHTLRASDPRFGQWLGQAKQLRLQILVTVVDDTSDNWTRYEFRVDDEYFYPASAIKTFLAVAVLRHTSGLLAGDIPLGTRILRCRFNKPGCRPFREDAKKDEPGHPKVPEKKKKHQKLRIGQEIRKMLSYSDNDSFNRLYDIIGHRELNEAMAALGFASVRFHHKMNVPAKWSRTTPRVTLLPVGKAAIRIPLRKSDYQLAPTAATGLDIGNAYNDGGKLVESPMSFAEKNAVSLRDLQRINISLLYPDHPLAAPLGLSDAQRAHIIKAMTARLSSRKRAAEHGPLTPGMLDVLPIKRARYVSKSGRAYGFHLENAFIQDTQTKRAMFVTVVVYANPNGVLNDDDYGYDDTSKPLLAAVGKALTGAIIMPESP
ncbi:MAG TPA: hypothetical protein ENK23_05125 [Sorangium sp.]|nr:hypothetical protein [Sorangium sp.]